MRCRNVDVQFKTSTNTLKAGGQGDRGGGGEGGGIGKTYHVRSWRDA
jgi:hypothetical protein